MGEIEAGKILTFSNFMLSGKSSYSENVLSYDDFRIRFKKNSTKCSDKNDELHRRLTENISNNFSLERMNFPDNSVESKLKYKSSITQFKNSTSNYVSKFDERKYSLDFERLYIEIFRSDEIESGMESNCEKYFRKELDLNRLLAVNALNHVYLSNHNNEQILLSILSVISHIDFDEIYPLGPIIALASLSHKSEEIKEYAIRAFENWESPDSLDTLKSFEVREGWLREYLDDVIALLERVVNGPIS